MYRATTPTHKFIFSSYNPQTFQILNIYYAQQGKELLKKEKSDCNFYSKETEKGIIYVAYIILTQEETKLFKPKVPVKIQLRAVTQDDKVIASEEYEVPVFNVINDEVL